MPLEQLSELEERVGALINVVDDLSRSVSGLQGFVDGNDANIRESLASVSIVVDSLKIMVYGSESIRMIGMVDRLENVERIVGEIVQDRRSERDKLKGIQKGLLLTAAASGGTLTAILAQIFNGVG